MGKTLFEKIWAKHVVRELDDGTSLIYVDRHLVHEVTSPQAFEGMRLAGRSMRVPELRLTQKSRRFWPWLFDSSNGEETYDGPPSYMAATSGRVLRAQPV